MKRYLKVLAVLLTGFLLSCSGGNMIVKTTPEPILKGMKEINRGTGWYRKGCYQKSLEHFFRAHELFAAADQQSGVAMSMNNIGTVYRLMGDGNSALLFFEESYRTYMDIGDHPGALQALSNKAAVLIDRGRLEEAQHVLDTADQMARTRDKPFEPPLINRGILLIKKGKYLQAEELLNQALDRTNTSSFSELATINYALGNLLLQTGHPEKAVAYFEASLAADRVNGFYKGMADNLAALGSVCLNQRKIEEAVKYFNRGIKIYALLGDKEKVSEIMEKLSAASQQAIIDISVTQHFVDRWLEGKILENPCD